MIKDMNMMVTYHGGQLYIIPTLLKFTNMTQTQIIENLLIENKRDKIPPFFVVESS